jgi:hypothetical protein
MNQTGIDYRFGYHLSGRENEKIFIHTHHLFSGIGRDLCASGLLSARRGCEGEKYAYHSGKK